jgi:hypothetical protein
VEASFRAVGGVEGQNSLGFLSGLAQPNSLLWHEPFFYGSKFFDRKGHFAAPDRPNRIRLRGCLFSAFCSFLLVFWDI